MTSRSEPDAQAGFTLVEMLVVIAILGLMTSLMLANGFRVSPAVQARAAAQAISSALREARSESVSTNRSIAFTLDLTSRRYQWGGRPAEALPGDLQFSLLTSQDQFVSEQAGSIRFDPDGGSSGGRVSIAGGGQVWMVGVDWLSGHVSVETQKQQ